VTPSCSICGFALWLPVADLHASTAGLYDDGRFPGRLIVSAQEHYDHLDEMPSHTLNAFMRDVQTASQTLRQLPEVVRVNVSVLGNVESHVHAHLIPRRPGESNFDKAPWDQAPARRRLGDNERVELLRSLAALFGDSASGSAPARHFEVKPTEPRSASGTVRA
jgi:diadenosine tetraphosphate (Ap4A) HIT family hydrolase